MPEKPDPIQLLDYGTLEGGLTRMMNRFRDEGSMTGDSEADDFVKSNGNAALLGMLFDQRIRAEYAFIGTVRLRDRLGHLDMNLIAKMDGEKLREKFAEKPAVHRFTNKMADMTRAVAKIISDEYNGDASNMWNDGSDFSEIQKRVKALPGFGPQKSYKMKFVLHYFGHRDFGEE